MKKALAMQFGLRIFLLCILCVMPSYEMLKSRLSYHVTTEDSEVFEIELKEGDVVSQEVYMDEDVHLRKLSVGIASSLEDGQAELVVTVKQGEVSQSEYLTENEIPIAGRYELSAIDFSQYSKGSVQIEVEAKKLLNGRVFVQAVPQIIYGYEAAEKNGVPQEGGLLLAFSGWSFQNEGVFYSIAWILVIGLLAVAAAYLMTYKSEWQYFDRGIRIVTFGLIVVVFSLLYPSFVWYGCDWCEGIFYYQKIQENNLLQVLFSSDFNLYIAAYNNIFMYLAVKVFGIDTYTFVVLQVLTVGILAYWGTLFCKKQYGKYFPIDFRVGAAIVSICYLYTMQEFSFIGAAYFGILFLLYIITYDFSGEKRSFVLSAVVIVIVCMSKMSFILFCPIGILFLLFWRKSISKRNRILLWIMSGASFMEALLSVLLNGGLSGGSGLGSIQSISLFQLITGALYYAIQIANSVFFHGMIFDNALLINMLMFAAILGMLLWCIREILKKQRFQKAAGFIFIMFILSYGNCALQLLTNSYSMTPDNVHWDKIFYIPVEDKWWWFAFGYVAMWAVALSLIYILSAFWKEHISDKRELQGVSFRLGSIFLSFLICIITVNQYAYHEENLQSYKTANMFNTPSMMQGNFTEYSFMQKDEKFLIVTSAKPGGQDWFYIHNADYVTVDLEERCQTLDLSSGSGEEGFIAIYVHKSDFTNQMKDGKYQIRLYREDGEEIARFNQLDTDLHREYICFYFEGQTMNDVAYVSFYYEDGTEAYIDGPVRLGVCH